MALLPLLSEVVVDLIIDKLKAEINPTLQTADFKYGDGISLAPIQKSSYYISNLIEPLVLPACFVMMGDHAFQYSDNPNYLESEDTVLVAITMEGIGDQNVTRMAFRYARALYGVLNLAHLEDSNGPDNRIGITLIPQRIDYTQAVGQKMDDRETRFRKDVLLTLKVMHYEKNLT